MIEIIKFDVGPKKSEEFHAYNGVDKKGYANHEKNIASLRKNGNDCVKKLLCKWNLIKYYNK